jgi:hypothetical protein
MPTRRAQPAYLITTISSSQSNIFVNNNLFAMDISSLVNNTPPPTSDVNNTQTAPQSALFGAIDSATPERVRQVLREICATNPEAFRSACDKLLVANDAAIALPDSDMKRKRETHQLRYEICVQCEEEYDVLDNEEGACEWHPGPYFTLFIPTFVTHINRTIQTHVH